MSEFDGRSYQSRFDSLAAKGVDVHGEATFVRTFGPTSALDAGCGTGRVAIELARHGIDVVAVDVDPSMIAEARRLAPELEILEADLADFDLGRTFDVVLLAGNVPLFCPEESRRDLVRSCANHVNGGGVMIAGFQLGRRYELVDLDDAAASAGLILENRFSTWDGVDFDEASDYAVSVLRRPR
ncbi:MAG: class I SAM-dependent methyltransferase [Actinomycetes bacterium]